MEATASTEKDDNSSEPERTGVEALEAAVKTDQIDGHIPRGRRSRRYLCGDFRQDFIKYIEREHQAGNEAADRYCKCVDQVLGLAIARLPGYEEGLTFDDVKETNEFVTLHSELLHEKVAGKNRRYVTGW